MTFGIDYRKFGSRLLVCTLSALIVGVGLSKPAAGQVSGATLSGEISDNSGAIVPGALVTAQNISNGSSRSAKTNDAGFYVIPNLLPGSYTVKVEATGFSTVLQEGLTLTVGAQQTYDGKLLPGKVSQTVIVTTIPPSIQSSSSGLNATVDSRTVRELPLNGRDWTSLATLEPGVVSIPNQATTGFSANKGNRGFGNQLSDGGHRANENTYRVNGMVTNDYSNAAPGGATGVNLGVDAIGEFSVLTANYTAEYGRTSGAVINAITKSGTNAVHGTAYFFDRDSIFDARNYFDGPQIPSFRRLQFGGSAGAPIYKDHSFIFVDYEGIRQSQSNSGTIHVPDAASRALAVPAIVPYLALWPVAPTSAPDINGIQSLNVSTPTHASENYVITRFDQKISNRDNLDATYFFDSGPQTQADPLNNAVHGVFSRRQLYTAEETHVFSPSFANTLRGGVSRIIGKINTPISGNAVATDAALAIAPGSKAPPQLPVAGLTTAYGLNGFNKFNHAWTSGQIYDDAFLTKGTHSIKLGFAFERMRYNVLEQLSPNGRMNTYSSLGKFLSNQADQLNALAPGGSTEVGLRESLFAGYVQDDWTVTKNFTLNLGLRYEATTKPTDSNTVPGYTVNGYTVAAAGFQEITTLVNCGASSTACGPVGVNSPISSNPTTKDFEPRVGFSWDPFNAGKTAVRGAFGMFDVLPLPYEFGLNTAATAPFQIIGTDPNATLGTGVIDGNVNFNRQKIRNRYIDIHPKRAAVYNWNVNIQQDLGQGFMMTLGYVGSRSLHLSAAADDINLVQGTVVSGVGLVFPCDPSSLSAGSTCANTQTGTRVDPNWGGGAGIRPVLFDGAASYEGLQSQLKKTADHGIQGQLSYTWSKCRDLSSAPVTGDTYLNSIAVPLLFNKQARIGACDFDIRQVLTGNFIWEIPAPNFSSSFANFAAHGWEVGSIVTAETGAPFTVTVGGGNDPLGTGFNGDYSMDFADVLPGCKPTGGKGLNYINTNCFTPPTAPLSLGVATAANPLGCAPNSFLNYSGPAAPAGRQFCSNVLGNSGRNSFYGPRLTTVDFSLFKNTKVPRISDTFNVQFRAEFFNILNHTNYLSPGFLNSFGQNNSAYDFDGTSLPTALNQTSSSSRQIQLGAKFVF
ncbi:TonB-dependent receptor [Tunturiibacter gelidoferens]|uniref:Uncharacterized protein n=1 Tax=Tunturiibacter gelidiferens TaxID=3069689 RepID=A0ACC5P457_9BACT|nr:carboxypeptidase regulatory-like domain-containing protein [Edaphobacter lichenicola]MBB5341590.1 hypothetical protein [Edaphobacter lichenicola]